MAPRRRGVYPGSFDPPTVAHLAIAEAAVTQRGLDLVVLVLSRVALGKEAVAGPTVAEREAVLLAECAERPWLDVAVTEHQLVADIARGYDVVVMGADKWAQVNDPRFYGGDRARMRAAVASLPDPAIAPRPPFPVPARLGLDLPADLHDVSSTQVRGGRHDWMTPAAEAFDSRTGAWSDPERYRAWRTGTGT